MAIRAWKKYLLLIGSGTLFPLTAQTQTTKVMPVTIRDFTSSHADFENANSLVKGGTCPADGGGMKGMVEDTLDAQHKPIKSKTSPCPQYDIQNWFRDQPPVNTRICQDLTLTQVVGSANTFQKQEAFFFPIDKAPGNTETFKADDGLMHNFHFCMEMHATFKYRGGEVFDFKGDDDVWVFVNNRLALDLGGLQNNGAGQVNLDTQKDALKIAVDNYYNFDFFFCERQTTGSHLQITTSIDIVPATPGFHIADANGNILASGDTLSLAMGDISKVFNGVKIEALSQTIDCSNVSTITKTDVPGKWTLGPTPLTPGKQAILDPKDFPTAGIVKLVFTPDSDPTKSEFVYVKIVVKRVAIPARGYYQDLNGDGKIETAVILYDTTRTTPPTDIKLTDPFKKTNIVSPIPTAPVDIKVTVSLAIPFTPGTLFPTENLALVDGVSIPMEDSVGPFLSSIISTPSADSKIIPMVEIVFSEPVNIDVNSKAFPFDLKRGVATVNPAEISVLAITMIAPGSYRYTFAVGSKYPIPGDSLRIATTPGITDSKGNRSTMMVYVPVGGKPALAVPEIDLGLKEPVTQGLKINPQIVANPIVVTNPMGTCVNCTDVAILKVIGGTDTKTITTLGPTWKVATKYPFQYDMVFFDNVGQFVNTAKGEITMAQFNLLRGTGKIDDSVTVFLTFLPITENGSAIATGAYIMKGTLLIQDTGGTIKGSQGETLKVSPAKKIIVSRFGYVRR